MIRKFVRCMTLGKRGKRSAWMLLILAVCFAMSGCHKSLLPLTPENILDTAYLQDQNSMLTAFSLTEREYSVRKNSKGEVYTISRPVILDGREANEFFVEFWDRGMIAVTYRFYFIEAEGEGLSDAWKYAIRQQKNLSEAYGNSIYDSYYGFIPSSQFGVAVKDESEAANYFAEPGNSLGDVFPVSEDCVAEVILMSTPGEMSMVSLKYHIYPEYRPLQHSQKKEQLTSSQA